jgi:hypothetical protein
MIGVLPDFGPFEASITDLSPLQIQRLPAVQAFNPRQADGTCLRAVKIQLSKMRPVPQVRQHGAGDLGAAERRLPIARNHAEVEVDGLPGSFVLVVIVKRVLMTRATTYLSGGGAWVR